MKKCVKLLSLALGFGLCLPLAWAQTNPQSIESVDGLSISQDGVLLYQGKPLEEGVEANKALHFERPYRLGKRTVVLLRNDGGESCPALYHFVSIADNKAEATPPFGTCSNQIKVRQERQMLFVSMPEFLPADVDETLRQQAAKTIRHFRYDGESVTENEKAIKR